MRVSLSGKGGSQVMNWCHWAYVMQLGFTHGWRPQGTECPNDFPGGDVEWDGGYTSNDGPWVTAEDADAWAAALERALACDHETCSHVEPRDAGTRDPERREWLGRVIAFFRKGGFFIY